MNELFKLYKNPYYEYDMLTKKTVSGVKFEQNKMRAFHFWAFTVWAEKEEYFFRHS